MRQEREEAVKIMIGEEEEIKNETKRKIKEIKERVHVKRMGKVVQEREEKRKRKVKRDKKERKRN